MGILLLISAILAMFGKSRNFALIFGLLTLIFCLITPIFFMVMHPGAVNDDLENPSGEGAHDSFMGSVKSSEELYDSTVTTEETWGPGIGWILTWIGFVFAVLGFIFAFRIPRPIGKSIQTPENPPQQPEYHQL